MCNIGERLHQITLAVFLFFIYFFFPFPGRQIRAKRMVEAANPAEYEYMEGSIPIEWEGTFGLQNLCRILYLSLILNKKRSINKREWQIHGFIFWDLG